MKLRRPSPAMMIAIIALIAACTGTAFAATIITSSIQIKNGVVTSGDVKNGSLQGVDLRKSTITESKLSAGVVKKLGRGVAGGGDRPLTKPSARPDPRVSRRTSSSRSRR